MNFFGEYRIEKGVLHVSKKGNSNKKNDKDILDSESDYEKNRQEKTKKHK